MCYEHQEIENESEIDSTPEQLDLFGPDPSLIDPKVIEDFEKYLKDTLDNHTNATGVGPLETPRPVEIDAHYSLEYFLQDDEVEKRYIRMDPYRVAKTWRLSQRDSTGGLFHILKTLARNKVGNTMEREIKAIYKTIKRVAEIEGVDLE
jgi:hypothetical protein